MSLYSSIDRAITSSKPVVICTVVQTTGSAPRHAGSKMLVYQDGSIEGTVGGGEVEQRVIQEAVNAINTSETKLLEYQMVDPGSGDPGVCGGTVKVFIEPIIPAPSLLIIGGGHVGKALVHLAKWLGFRVVISDDRPELCNSDVHPEADEHILAPMKEIPNHVYVNKNMYIVLTTRGSSIDVDGLDALLVTDAAYIGVIGSKRRWLTTINGLIQKGVLEEVINKVHSPIGLEIGAETPEEIAVSIMAEIVMLRYNGTGRAMKL